MAFPSILASCPSQYLESDCRFLGNPFPIPISGTTLYHLYFNRTLFSHGSFTETAAQRQVGYVSQSSTDYVRPENQRAAALLREDFRGLTLADVERQAEQMPWGTPQEVTERIIAAAEHCGANMVQIGFNRGAMPHEMFIEQIRRFARDVLPALQAHEVKRVRATEVAD